MIPEEKPKPLFWRLAGGLIPAALAVLAFFVIRHEMAVHSIADVTRAMRDIPAHRVVWALVWTLLTYWVLSLYDVLALVYGGKTLPYRQSGSIAATAFALGSALGFNAVTGGLVRIRLYARLGLTALDAARVSAFNLLTFWVGLGAAGGVALLYGHMHWPPSVPTWLPTPRMMGILFLAAVFAYLLACYRWPGRTFFGKAHISVPPFRLGLGQVLLGTAEWLASAAVLWVLLPGDEVGFGWVLGVFVVSLILGLVSTLPGGLGIFESSALYFLGRKLGTPQVLGVLLVYRLIYTLAPFALALFAFIGMEIQARNVREKAKRA